MYKKLSNMKTDHYDNVILCNDKKSCCVCSNIGDICCYALKTKEECPLCRYIHSCIMCKKNYCSGLISGIPKSENGKLTKKYNNICDNCDPFMNKYPEWFDECDEILIIKKDMCEYISRL